MFLAFCYLLLNVFVGGENNTNNTVIQNSYLHVNDVARALINTLDIDNERIDELKEKIKKIDRYVIDRDKYADYIKNEVNRTNLNETNFFNSLNESDGYKFLSNGESKSLYLKIKEKMNRDDIVKILSERGKNSKLMKSARKMMLNEQMGTEDVDDVVVDTVIDKFIGSKAKDNHKYNRKVDKSQWDPQGELEDLKEYHRHDGRRIFRGERTTIKFYPFMASVHVMGRFWCGGAIYSSDLILTSAACLQLTYNNRFFRENPGSLAVRIGSNHSRIGGEKIAALEVYFHPSYNPKTLRGNIAVIRLHRHIRFDDDRRIPKRIDISYNDQGIPPTSEVLVLGWGVTKMSQKLSHEPIFLNRKILPIYPNVFCKEVYGDKFITRDMFCAGTFTTGEGACGHDAGGPAIIAGKLVGIISFGPAVCGYPNTPTVFTLVGAYADWIETVAENMPSYYTGRARTTKAPPKYTDIMSLTTPNTRIPIIVPINDFNNTVPLATDIFLKEGKNTEELNGWSIELGQ